MKKAFLLSLIFLSSCMNKNPYRKIASFEKELSCYKIVTHFSSYTDIKVFNKYSKYLKYNDSLTFSKREQELEKKIRYWANTGDRETTIAQMRHNGAFSRIDKLLKIDTAFAVSRQLTELFSEAEQAYFIGKKAFREAQIINRALDDLKLNGGLEDGSQAELFDYLHNNPLIKTSLTKELIKKAEGNSLRRNLRRDLALLNDNLLEHTLKLAVVIDEYSVTRRYLEENVNDPDIGEKAQKVLSKLVTKDILDTCHACGDPETLTRPTMTSMKKMSKALNVVRIKYLERELMAERLLSIGSRLPSQQVFQLLDGAVSKVSWLKDSGFRKWLRKTYIDYKDMIKYFPNIDRILFSNASEEELSKLIMEFMAKDNEDEFLIAFARRIDANEKFMKIYNWLEQNAPNDQYDLQRRLFLKMREARVEAANRGMIAEWHSPKGFRASRLLIDSTLYALVGYGTYLYTHDKVEDFEDSTGIDILKDEELKSVLEQELSSEELKKFYPEESN